MLSDRPFRFTLGVEVRFRDLDALGHVNNAVYLTYFESARMAWWMHLTRLTDLRQMDMILARAEIDFRSPAAYPEVLDVGVRCASIGRSSFVIEQAITERRTRRLVAEARKVLVHYDYAASRSTPLTEEQRRQLLDQDPDAEVR
ncbi:MAG TPA: thioesterase family protein [Vicinamibacteria bacterium]|jgi:acyl-CoA thioester hydrolase